MVKLLKGKCRFRKLRGIRGKGNYVIVCVLLYSSGPNDRVFVNFADHGAPGLIAFPSDEVRLFFFSCVNYFI